MQGAHVRPAAPAREDASRSVTEEAIASLSCPRSSRGGVSESAGSGVMPATVRFCKDGGSGTGAQRVGGSGGINGIAGTGRAIVRGSERRPQGETNGATGAMAESWGPGQYGTSRRIGLPPPAKERRGLAVSEVVKTSLDFRKATVQLKVS